MYVSEVETPFHHVMEIVTALGVPAILAAVGKLIWGAAKLQTTVDVIKNNHLVHLDQKIDGVQGDVDKIRDAFIEHLQTVK